MIVNKYSLMSQSRPRESVLMLTVSLMKIGLYLMPQKDKSIDLGSKICNN